MEGASQRRRKQKNVCTAQDYDELRKAYRFIPPDAGTAADVPGSGTATSSAANWQERMARRYERHLYREFVLADLTRYKTGQVGLRWRTKDEVVAGKGFDTCGNKHCRSYQSDDGSKQLDIEAARRAALSRTSEDAARRYNSEGTHNSNSNEKDEEIRLSQMPYGAGLADYEVPFSYVERDEKHTELVKLRLCLRCAPLLFYGRGGALGARQARSRVESNMPESGKSGNTESIKQDTKLQTGTERRDSILSASSQGSDSRSNKRRRKRKEKKKKAKRKGRNDRDRRRRKKNRSVHRSSHKYSDDSEDSSVEHYRRCREGEATDIESDDSEGMRAEKELLSSLEQS